MLFLNRPLATFALVSALLAVSGATSAHAGKLLGRYVYSSFERCQITFDIRRTGSGQINRIDGKKTYEPMRGDVGIARFSSTDGGATGLATVFAKGFEGDNVRVQDGQRTNGLPIKNVGTKFKNEAYTATGNKLTIAGFTFQAVYGQADNAGIAQSVHLMRKLGVCIQQLVMTR